MTKKERFMKNAADRQELWYIAAPYAHPNNTVRADRVERVEKCVTAIIKSWTNIVPFAPILYTRPLQRRMRGAPKKGWYAFDIPFLQRSDTLMVITLDGWKESFGVGIEIATATAGGIPVRFYSEREILGDDIPF